MAILLGIDTGGTYTDAVLHDEQAPHPGVVAKAKSLTTRHDLSLGIGRALYDVLACGETGEGLDPAAISLVSISTTLATNALVEGVGGRILLVLVGFEASALERAGLGTALGTDPHILIAGGHTPSGDRQAPLDLETLGKALPKHAPAVDGIAVVAYFGTRNPVDEITVRDFVISATGLPVTCGHELASDLNGPKRALTAVLNARLIGVIAELIASTERILERLEIKAPLMLVRGDGSLVSADFARSRPIETILSGPAASIVGAAHLTGLRDAVVSDIGGTTTDIAILEDGRPALSPDGAIVGGHHTMVEAVDMRTHGIGGDSEIQVDDTSLSPRLRLGPARVIPLSLLATDHADAIHAAMDTQIKAPMPNPHDGRFVMRAGGSIRMAGLRPADQALLDLMTGRPMPLQKIIRQNSQLASLRRLVARGLAVMSGFTPTDAVHVLEQHSPWDAEAARKGAVLLARRRSAAGRAVADNEAELSRLALETLVKRSANALIDATTAHDRLGPGTDSSNPLIGHALAEHIGATRLDIGLAMPLVGLGASAHLHYPAIAKRLRTASVIPEDAGVANALGAVVGNVRVSAQAIITQPTEGCFRVQSHDGMQDFTNEDAARAFALETSRSEVQLVAQSAGATDIELTTDWDDQRATIEGRRVLVQATVRLTASGRPRLG